MAERFDSDRVQRAPSGVSGGPSHSFRHAETHENCVANAGAKKRAINALLWQVLGPQERGT